MSLEQLTVRAIQTRRLDNDTHARINRLMNRRSHLTAEEYEALCRLGRALKAGEVKRDTDGGGGAHA